MSRSDAAANARRWLLNGATTRLHRYDHEKPRKTLSSEFAAGVESGKHPHADNTRKAIEAIVRKSTAPLVRAYWAGYLCQLTTDNPDAITHA